MTDTMVNTMVGAGQAGAINMGTAAAGFTGTPSISAGRVTGRSRRASRNMLKAAIALVAAVFILVGLSAYAASIQHANNVLAEENAYLQAEIDSLNSQIVEETKVTKVERIATRKYGMVYPTSDNCIVINEREEISSKSLAAEIRSEAYN